MKKPKNYKKQDKNKKNNTQLLKNIMSLFLVLTLVVSGLTIALYNNEDSTSSKIGDYTFSQKQTNQGTYIYELKNKESTYLLYTAPSKQTQNISEKTFFLDLEKTKKITFSMNDNILPENNFYPYVISYFEQNLKNSKNNFIINKQLYKENKTINETQYINCNEANEDNIIIYFKENQNKTDITYNNFCLTINAKNYEENILLLDEMIYKNLNIYNLLEEN